MVAAVALAVHSLLALRGGHASNITFAVIGWLAFLSVGISAMIDFSDYLLTFPI